jgi:predicted Rossmann fold flavoprotein
LSKKKIVIIGGGASGFFAAINIALRSKQYDISILEKTGKILSKVKVSGGGRCNLTHYCFDINELVKNYPRGQKELKQVFHQFDVQDTIDWFEKQGLKLKVEDDGRMFPQSNSSQSVIDLFCDLAKMHNIKIITGCEVFSIKKTDKSFHLKTNLTEMAADAIVCCMGGHHKEAAYHLIKNLGHSIKQPIPSLFTLNLPKEIIRKQLQGLSVPEAQVRVVGSSLKYHGPVLITHWGLSGPAVLKLSAFAAQEFFEANYHAGILVNWVYPKTNSEVEAELKLIQKNKHKALPYSSSQFGLPKRLWEFLCLQADIDNSKPWAELSNKQLHKLTENLSNSNYQMEGKTTFKEEFVSCGGVNLKEVDFKTMQSKLVPGLYFSGEVLDIDGITGGFNFQSAWSTAWICANSI